MGAGHAHAGVDALYVHGHTVVHELAPECKVAAAVLFVFAVVATPPQAVWAFAAHALVVAAVIAAADLAPRLVVRRLVVEVPFLAFALFLPFVAGGERIDLLGVSVSENGAWAAWNVLAKATIGVATTVVLASTTQVTDLLRGMDRLRVPRAFTSIAGFMVRYADVVAGEVQRMKVARLARGYDPRWIWQARAVAASAGTLFVRSYERGERVYLAMLSRNYRGALPDFGAAHASPLHWAIASSLPVAGALVAVAAWVLG